jgi:iron complex outermembrane receptor protein
MRIFCMLAVCLFVNSVLAQNTKLLYSLKITVKDSITGLFLEEATVKLTKHAHAHVTNTRGDVVFDTLSAGHYHLTCTYIGYYSYETSIDLPNQSWVTVLLCPSSYHLHEMIIEGNATQNRQSFSTQSSTALNQTQIEKMRGQNLGELLKNVNGMTTLNTGPGISKPVLRGLHSNRVVMLNNGVRQEEQQWGSEHAPAIDPFAVNKVEVIKGAASVEYGPEAIGGVVRLSPRPYSTMNGLNGEISLQGFSNNKQGSATAMLQGTHLSKQQLSWRAQGTLRKAGDSRAPDYVISNTGFDEQNGNVSAAYLNKKLYVEVFASVFNSTIGIMRAAHIGSSTDLVKAINSDKPFIVKPFTYAIGKPYQQVWHELQSFKLSYAFTVLGKLEFQAARQLNSRKEYDLGLSWNPQSQTKPAYHLTLTTYTYDGVFEHKKWKNIVGKVGGSLMAQSNYTEGMQKPLIPNFIANTYGFFVFEKWKKGRWTAELGSRFDKRNQTIYQRNNKNEIITQRRGYQRATAIVGGSYMLSEKLKLSSTFSSAWRPPSVNELYSNGLHNGTATYEIGDSNLIPERSYNVDVNLKYQHTKWVLETSIFRNTIYNFIYQLPKQTPTITLRGTFPSFVFTQTDAVMHGAEMNVSCFISNHLSTTGAISYLLADDAANNQPLIYMPANRVKLGVQYQTNTLWKAEHFFAELNWQYIAEQKRFPQNLDYKSPPPAYNLLDINMGFEFPVKQQHIRVSASVNNVFNETYRDYLSRFRYFTDEPGRNFIVRLTIPFQLFKTNNK